MAQVSAVILLHTGSGPRHFDLIIGQGRRCPTLRIEPQGRQWQISWANPHRRWYLSYRGPVSGGRGRVQRAWSGPVSWSSDRILLPGCELQLRRKSVVPSRGLRKLLIA